MTEQNPYEAPQGDLESSNQEVGEIRFFSADCRIGRLRYLAHLSLLMVIMYAILGGCLALMMLESTPIRVVAGIIIFVIYIGAIYLSIVMMIQRLHDLNQSGWFWLLSFVPIANLFIMIWVIFFPGTKGANNYGHRPPPNKAWHWILAIGFPIVIVGVLAAVAIPAYQGYIERAQQSSFELSE